MQIEYFSNMLGWARLECPAEGLIAPTRYVFAMLQVSESAHHSLVLCAYFLLVAMRFLLPLRCMPCDATKDMPAFLDAHSLLYLSQNC